MRGRVERTLMRVKGSGGILQVITDIEGTAKIWHRARQGKAGERREDESG